MSLPVAEFSEPKEVTDMLRAKSALEEYAISMELIRECFPERRGLEIYLQDDPDEAGITCVILEVVLPESMPFEVLNERRDMYYTERRRRLPALQWPICGLSVDFA